MRRPDSEAWMFDPSGGNATALALPPPRRRRPQGSRVRDVSKLSLGPRSENRPPDRVVRQRGTDRSPRRPRPAGRAAQRQREHARRRVRGHADHGQHRAGDAAGIAGPYPRLRRQYGQAAMDFPHDSPTRRVRLRHVAEGRVQDLRRRERVGGRDARRQERHRVRRNRVGVVRLLRRRRGTATISSRTACSRSTRAPANASGISRQ